MIYIYFKKRFIYLFLINISIISNIFSNDFINLLENKFKQDFINCGISENNNLIISLKDLIQNNISFILKNKEDKIEINNLDYNKIEQDHTIEKEIYLNIEALLYNIKFLHNTLENNYEKNIKNENTNIDNQDLYIKIVGISLCTNISLFLIFKLLKFIFLSNPPIKKNLNKKKRNYKKILKNIKKY